MALDIRWVKMIVSAKCNGPVVLFSRDTIVNPQNRKPLSLRKEDWRRGETKCSDACTKPPPVAVCQTFIGQCILVYLPC